MATRATSKDYSTDTLQWNVLVLVLSYKIFPCVLLRISLLTWSTSLDAVFPGQEGSGYFGTGLRFYSRPPPIPPLSGLVNGGKGIRESYLNKKKHIRDLKISGGIRERLGGQRRWYGGGDDCASITNLAPEYLS